MSQTLVGSEETWECLCPGEHRTTTYRAWCFDCHEWCSSYVRCLRSEWAEQELALANLRQVARAVVQEWDERGDHGCSVAVQDALRKELAKGSAAGGD